MFQHTKIEKKKGEYKNVSLFLEHLLEKLQEDMEIHFGILGRHTDNDSCSLAKEKEWDLNLSEFAQSLLEIYLELMRKRQDTQQFHLTCDFPDDTFQLNSMKNEKTCDSYYKKLQILVDLGKAMLYRFVSCKATRDQLNQNQKFQYPTDEQYIRFATNNLRTARLLFPSFNPNEKDADIHLLLINLVLGCVGLSTKCKVKRALNVFHWIPPLLTQLQKPCVSTNIVKELSLASKNTFFDNANQIKHLPKKKSLNNINSEPLIPMSASKEKEIYESSPPFLRCTTLDTASGSLLSTVGEGSLDNETFISSQSFNMNGKDKKYYTPLSKTAPFQSPSLPFCNTTLPSTCHINLKNSSTTHYLHSSDETRKEKSRLLRSSPQRYVCHDQNKLYDTRLRPKSWCSLMKPVFKKTPDPSTCFNNFSSPFRTNPPHPLFQQRLLYVSNKRPSVVGLQHNYNRDCSTFSKPMFSSSPSQRREIQPIVRNVSQPYLKSTPSLISTHSYKPSFPVSYRSIPTPASHSPQFFQTVPTPPHSMPTKINSSVRSKNSFTSLDKQTFTSLMSKRQAVKQPPFLNNCRGVPMSFENFERHATQPKIKGFSEPMLHHRDYINASFLKNMSHIGVWMREGFQDNVIAQIKSIATWCSITLQKTLTKHDLIKIQSALKNLFSILAFQSIQKKKTIQKSKLVQIYTQLLQHLKGGVTIFKYLLLLSEYGCWSGMLASQFLTTVIQLLDV